jgi:hypothetical protein
MFLHAQAEHDRARPRPDRLRVTPERLGHCDDRRGGGPAVTETAGLYEVPGKRQASRQISASGHPSGGAAFAVTSSRRAR